MPLQDHFHPPLKNRRHWTSFHHAWATYIASALNQNLPEGYFAEPNVKFGIEIDVATFEEGPKGGDFRREWSPAPPTLTVPISLLTDVVEITIYSSEGGPTLAGAIELVSPANKDRDASRAAFVTKCAAYVQLGVGLAMVDVVTDRQANLHEMLVNRVAMAAPTLPAAELFAASFRPIQKEEQPFLDIWFQELRLGQTLPTLPLWLPGEVCMPVELEESYQRTCRELRIQGNGPSILR